MHLKIKPLGILLILLVIYGNGYRTLGVLYLDVRCWAAESHGDFLEAGVKGQLPSVADPAEMISGQQVDL